MPSRTRDTATTTPATTTTTPSTSTASSPDNSILSSLLSGATRLDGEASSWFAQGIHFQRGMKGELVKRVQRACKLADDGSYGPNTAAGVSALQKKAGLPETGVVDQATWDVVVQKTMNLKNLSGEDDFARMWGAHPHNYMSDESQNTSSEALRDQLGMTEAQAQNTCALRWSTMLNRLGEGTALTAERGIAAGLDKQRAGGLYMPRVKDPETASQNDRVIVSAKEMWTYIEKHRGPPDLVFPPRGRYKTQEEAQAGADACKAAVGAQKGIVAFDKIFGYGGSGHIDLFDGPQLSDGSWYASEAIKIWFIVKGDPQVQAATGA